jgi:hypothetical protein
MTEILDSLGQTLSEALPSILGALAVLVLGWFAAVLLRALVRKTLHVVKVNERIRSGTDSAMDIEGGAGAIVYWIVLLIAIIGFFNMLKLEQVSGTLQGLVDTFLLYAPKLVAGAVLMLVAWVLATMLRSLITRALAAKQMDEKLSAQAGMKPMSKSLGTVIYWLVILLFLPAILSALELEGLLAPVQGMVNEVLAMLPNIVGALVIGLAGWFLARILRDLVTSLLTATGVDRLGERSGMSGGMSLSRLIGVIVYFLVFVPLLIAALDALKVEAISGPATEMLSLVMGTVPNIFGAAIILAVAWFVAVFVANIVTTLLGGTGFDSVPEKLGLWKAEPGAMTPSRFSGKVIVFFIMLFATVEAAGRLGFMELGGFVSTMIDFAGQVLLGVGIIGVGIWLSQLAYRAMQGAGAGRAAPLAGVVRYAIIGIVVAMGLRAMGLADDIVNMAFFLTLGSIAVAVALSFGLGGREAAGKQMEHWMQKLRGR